MTPDQARETLKAVQHDLHRDGHRHAGTLIAQLAGVIDFIDEATGLVLPGVTRTLKEGEGTGAPIGSHIVLPEYVWVGLELQQTGWQVLRMLDPWNARLAGWCPVEADALAICAMLNRVPPLADVHLP